MLDEAALLNKLEVVKTDVPSEEFVEKTILYSLPLVVEPLEEPLPEPDSEPELEPEPDEP